MEWKSFWNSKEFVARNNLDLINKEAASNAFVRPKKQKLLRLLLRGNLSFQETANVGFKKLWQAMLVKARTSSLCREVFG